MPVVGRIRHDEPEVEQPDDGLVSASVSGLVSNRAYLTNPEVEQPDGGLVSASERFTLNAMLYWTLLSLLLLHAPKSEPTWWSRRPLARMRTPVLQSAVLQDDITT